ncbi:MAG TPA: methionyl-tRNA formyltransferase [Dissulfurispiraceae bacterium]|nr:methionyl-tRNA formyltransferase [Dissulfurispiraceae bacterium]
MGILFFGTPHFAVPSLQAILDAGEDVSLVISQPDKPKGRGHLLSAPPVKECALQHGIPVLQPIRMRDPELQAQLRSCQPEFIVVVAYGRILPAEILNIPARGCINVHGSLLPRYRGAAPIQWAIINGDQETGVCTMLMDEGLDTGSVLLCDRMPINTDDTTASLFEKLALMGAQTLVRTLRELRAGTVVPKPQEGAVVYAPPLKKEDGRIDWTRPAPAIARQVRGMYPWPSAFCYLGSERLKVTKAHAGPGAAPPGLIVKVPSGLLRVGAGEGLLQIDELQPDGKKTMSAAAFLAGRKIQQGNETLS